MDWGTIEASWGTRFPSDYKDSVAADGEGAIDDYLAVMAPETHGEPGVETAHEGMQQESWNAEDMWRAANSGESEIPRLISWGVDSSADILCWLATDSDPDKWPVVVWARGDARWTEYACGMLEFLCHLLRSEFDECPLGDTSLWGSIPRISCTRTRNSDSEPPRSLLGRENPIHTPACSASDRQRILGMATIVAALCLAGCSDTDAAGPGESSASPTSSTSPSAESESSKSSPPTSPRASTPRTPIPSKTTTALSRSS
ncbi:SMI1/KNR4 family protein [Streptomyces canus]|uniref:SMI1/KNR4 family protein n=1 Tax=Streptomyces canus TaxID=58343 RepID=UPI0036A95735